MISPGILYASTHLALAVEALLIALVLMGLHRLYFKGHLLQWSKAWGALAAYAFGSGLSLLLVLQGVPSTHAARILLTTGSVMALYAHVAWLLFGVREAAAGELVRTPHRRLFLAAALAAGAASALLFPGEGSANLRLLVRAGLPALLAGAAYLAAGVWMRRLRDGRPLLGLRLLSGVFAGYGLLQVHHFGVALAQALGAPYPRYARYMGFADLLAQAAIGLSLVLWFLEEERRRVVDAAGRLEHLAYHDPVTQLPNRQLFLDRLTQAVAQAFRTRDRVAVLCLAVDRFKAVNSSLGYAAGDELMRSVGERLRGALREGDTLAKFSGAEFGLVLTGLQADGEVETRAREVLDLFKGPFAAGRDLFLTPVIGAARFPGHGLYAEELFRNAQAALEAAKRVGGGRWGLYDPSRPAPDPTDLRLESDLRKALVEDQFELHYQPYLDLEGGRVRGFEALLRWRHPELGLLPPKEFLGLAETVGLGDELNLWSVQKALEQVSRWHGRGHLGLSVSVNLVARLFQDPELVRHIRRFLESHAVPLEAFIIEITESLAMQNPEASLRVLRELHQLGVRLAIDDFGTGYSSLSYLRNFPVHILKVDQSFVQRLPFDHPTVAIVEAVITMAHSLGLAVVAEGVETEEQRALLHKLRCDGVQGYLFSRPLEVAACETLLRESRENIRPLPGRG
jgi:diguanylate cyclase (GGDEF)-like protein